MLCQAAPAAARLRGELAQHPIRLMEEKRAQEAWRARHKFTTPIEISSNPRSIVTGGSIIRVSACGVERAPTLAVLGRELDSGEQYVFPAAAAHDRDFRRDLEGAGQRVLPGHPRAASRPPMPLPGGRKAHQVPHQVAGRRQGAGGDQPLRPESRPHHLSRAQCCSGRPSPRWQPSRRSASSLIADR